MNNNGFRTAESIAKSVRDILETYRDNPNKKDLIIEDLREIFNNKNYRKIVLDGNDFAVVFRKILGVRRLAKLKPLLLEINTERFSSVNW